MPVNESIASAETKKKSHKLKTCSSLYPDPGSNRDGLLHWCLRPARLPIPPSGRLPLGLIASAKVLIIFELANFLLIFFQKTFI